MYGAACEAVMVWMERVGTVGLLCRNTAAWFYVGLLCRILLHGFMSVCFAEYCCMALCRFALQNTAAWFYVDTVTL